MPRPTGKDEVAKEDGTKEGIKEGWLKGLETQTMPVSVVDRQVIMPGTAHRNEGKTPNQISLISSMMTSQNLPQKIKSLTSNPK